MDKYLTDTKFWQKRVKNYDKLQWVKTEDYLKAFVTMCQAKKQDNVLDLGTGTGTIAYALCDKVKKVIGVDYSKEMLKEAKKHNHKENINFVYTDIRSIPLHNNSFEIITARMVFHHLL